MAKIEDCPGLETFGSDVKAAMEALNMHCCPFRRNRSSRGGMKLIKKTRQ